MTITAHDLFSRGMRFTEDGMIQSESHRMRGESDGWSMAAFYVTRNEDVHPDQWEVHPEADEAVCVLTGSARVILRATDHEPEEVTVLIAGDVVVVPRGRWHRLEVDGPAELLSITKRRGTRLRKRTGLTEEPAA